MHNGAINIDIDWLKIQLKFDPFLENNLSIIMLQTLVTFHNHVLTVDNFPNEDTCILNFNLSHWQTVHTLSRLLGESLNLG